MVYNLPAMANNCTELITAKYNKLHHNKQPSCANLVAATRHFPRDSSRLYGMDQDSVKTRFSSSNKCGTGNSNVSSLSCDVDNDTTCRKTIEVQMQRN
jgi:hypothetical protein